MRLDNGAAEIEAYAEATALCRVKRRKWIVDLLGIEARSGIADDDLQVTIGERRTPTVIIPELCPASSMDS